MAVHSRFIWKSIRWIRKRNPPSIKHFWQHSPVCCPFTVVPLSSQMRASRYPGIKWYYHWDGIMLVESENPIFTKLKVRIKIGNLLMCFSNKRPQLRSASGDNWPKVTVLTLLLFCTKGQPKTGTSWQQKVRGAVQNIHSSKQLAVASHGCLPAHCL